MPKLGLTTALRLQGRLKLARLLELREEEMAKLAEEVEADPLCRKLAAAGALSRRPFPAAYFTARRMAGRELAPSRGAGLAELLDAEADLPSLMKRVGRKRFEENFLGEAAEGLSDAERARRCGLSLEEARRLRGLLDSLYVREEFEPAAAPAPARVFSAVAGIGVEKGVPVLRFFHREVWKGEWSVDEARLRAALAGASADEAERARRLLSRIAFLGRRQTSLYKALVWLLAAQADWLKTGDPSKRQPLTQRSLAVALGVDPSAVNRLISNKSVELPWGTEAPMKVLLPSGKTLAREKLAALARREPGLSDEGLRRALAERWQIHLSRRSIAQYRKELGLGGRGRRGGDLSPAEQAGGASPAAQAGDA